MISVAYNLPGLEKVQFDGPLVADIFKAKVKRWDDGRIKALNPGVSLPAKDIVVVHRADSSGTTYAFSDYLAKQSPDWKAAKDQTGNWPDNSIGGQGNQGVAQGVQQQEGAIGYVELAYVIQAKMQQAFLKNKDGRYLQASVDGATAAARSGNWRLKFSELPSSKRPMALWSSRWASPIGLATGTSTTWPCSCPVASAALSNACRWWSTSIAGNSSACRLACI